MNRFTLAVCVWMTGLILWALCLACRACWRLLRNSARSGGCTLDPDTTRVPDNLNPVEYYRSMVYKQKRDIAFEKFGRAHRAADATFQDQLAAIGGPDLVEREARMDRVVDEKILEISDREDAETIQAQAELLNAIAPAYEQLMQCDSPANQEAFLKAVTAKRIAYTNALDQLTDRAQTAKLAVRLAVKSEFSLPAESQAAVDRAQANYAAARADAESTCMAAITDSQRQASQ